MKVQFLGRSKKKFTRNGKWDYCFAVEGLKEWPITLTVKNSNVFCQMPYDGSHWDIYSVPTSMTSLTAYLGGNDNPDIYQDFYDDLEPPFEVIAVYADGTQDVVTSVDARPKLTPQEEVAWLQAKTDWPVAVNPILIADETSEADKMDRAEGILEHLADFNLKQMKFLDFGCGEGHTAKKAIEQAVLLSVGFDPKVNPMTDGKLLLTTKFEDVISNSPYDFIILYDVLDHLDNETPESVLEKIKSVSKANTVIKLRCHPWISRHGAHQYKTTNKAFVHLVLPGMEPIHSLKINDPLRSYREWFNKAGFRIKKEEIVKESVESFFRLGMIKRRILENQGMQENELGNLEISFVDYELSVLS